MSKGYGQLSLDERIEIYRLHADGKSCRYIANALGRDASTISRELRRNSGRSRHWAGGYDPQRAEALMARRHARGRAHKLERQPELRKAVMEQLAIGRSPEQIAGRLALEHGKRVISYEAIYRYIYWRLSSFKENLHLLLPRKKYTRKRPGEVRGGSLVNRIKRRISIAKRPHAVNARYRIGHWEADTMEFSHQKRTVLILLERRSRFAILRTQKSRSSAAVVSAMESALKDLPAIKRQSVTMDNGPEFSRHYLLNDRQHIKTWFCDPHAPWQKGSVENSVGRLRRLLPKNTASDLISPARLRQIAQIYNNTPRKCLGFLTPSEAFFKKSF